MSGLIFRSPQIPAEWGQYFDLRWLVLREPWKQPRGSEQDELEATAHHTAGFKDGLIVAVGRLHEIADATGQIRYMAVAPSEAGRGLGSQIIAHLEAHARQLGLTHIELDARESARGFYKRHGYEVVGESPTKWGIAHQRMRKSL